MPLSLSLPRSVGPSGHQAWVCPHVYWVCAQELTCLCAAAGTTHACTQVGTAHEWAPGWIVCVCLNVYHAHV